MASDVEVLREFMSIRAFAVDNMLGKWAATFDAGRLATALSTAIAALEARESQPKAERQMTDAQISRLLKERDIASMERALAYETVTQVRKELAEAREGAVVAQATSAALSERVAQLEQALEGIASMHHGDGDPRPAWTRARVFLNDYWRKYAPPSKEPKP